MSRKLATTATVVVAIVLLLSSVMSPVQALVTKAPELYWPPRFMSMESFTIELRWWYGDCQVTQYHIQVYPRTHDGPELNLIRNTENARPCGDHFVLKPPPEWYFLLPEMTYYWRVRATDKPTFAPENDPSWGPWATESAFRTPLARSATITPKVPADKATVTPQLVVMEWENVDTNVFYYEVQVSGDSRFDTNPATATSFVWWNLVHGGVTNPPNSWQAPTLEPAKKYYWRVRPRVQGDGTPVDWPTAWSFTVATR